MKERRCPRCKCVIKKNALQCWNCGMDVSPQIDPAERAEFEMQMETRRTAPLLFNPDAFSSKMPIEERYDAQQTPEGQAAAKVRAEMALKLAQITGKPVKSGVVKPVFDNDNPNTIVSYYDE